MGFALMAIARALLIGQLAVSPYYASTMSVVIPCVVLCFFLSKYHDGRFFFAYFFSLNVYLIIRILTFIAALLPASAILGVWVEMLGSSRFSADSRHC